MPKKLGFTLIELLVVVAIIAILSLIGMAIFSGAQGKARDAKRRVDVDSIVKAYEQKYNPLSAQYSPIQDTDFTSGKIPTPSEGGNYTGYSTTVNTVSGFQICAKLEGFQGTCPATGADQDRCYCRSSSLGRLATTDTSPPPPPGGTTPPPPAAPASKPLDCENFGDMDKNGEITQNDGQIISEKIDSASLSEDEKIIADVNYNGSVGFGNVTATDILHINRYLNNEISHFNVCTSIKPPPCPGAGDVTTDGKVTLMDALEALRISAGGFNSLYTGQPYTNDQKTRANVADPASTGVNSTDSTLIFQYLDGKIQSFQSCPKDPPCFNKRGATGGMGDVDNDGKVSDNDRYLVHQSVANPALLSADQAKRADVDNTVGIEPTDVLAITNYLRGKVFQGVTNTFPVCSQ